MLLAAILPVIMSARAETLWQAWVAAQANDPEFQAARSVLDAARASHRGSIASLLPQVAFRAKGAIERQRNAASEFYGNQILSVSQSIDTHGTGWEVQLTQSVFDWAAIKNLQASELQTASAVATYQNTFDMLAEKVTRSYVNVLLAEGNLAASMQAEKAFAEQYREARERYKSGLAGVIGTDASEAALTSAQAGVLRARQREIAAKNALAALTGVPAENFPPLPTSFRIIHAAPAGVWLTKAYADNPRLASLRLKSLAAVARVGAAESGYMPSVSLVVTHSQYGQGGRSVYGVAGENIFGPDDERANDNSVGLQVTWDLFSGGGTEADVDRARALANESSAQVERKRLDIEREVKTRVAMLETYAGQISRLRKSVSLGQSAVRAIAEAVQIGRRMEDDLVTQRERLLSTQERLDETVAEAIDNQVGLMRSAGELTSLRVEAISEVLLRKSPSSYTRPGGSQ